MQLQSLTNLLGLGGPQAQPVAEGEMGDAFAKLLAGGKLSTVQELGAAQAAKLADVTAPVALAPAEQAAMQVELAKALAQPLSFQAPLPLSPLVATKPEPTGKALPPTGKTAAVPPPALAALPQSDLPASLAAPVEQQAEHETHKAETPATPTGFSDLALLSGWDFAKNPLFPAAQVRVETPRAEPPAVAVPNTVLAALPLAVPVTRVAKDRAAPQSDVAPIALPAEEAAVTASIPLMRAAPHERLPLAPRLAETAVPQQPAPQLAEAPAATAAEHVPPGEKPAAPEIELTAVIDHLVETRIRSREGRSEVNLPHPDFGRVTLALSLGGQDRLNLAMPDAPAELRVAVGQAFAPPARSDSVTAAPSADGTLASSNDARSQDRRDPQSGRGDQTRHAQHDNSTTPREQRRAASGRGVLA